MKAVINPERLVSVPFNKTQCGVDFYINTGESKDVCGVLTEYKTFKTDFFSFYFFRRANGYLCMGMGLLVLRACDLRDSGMDARRIAAKVSRLVPKVSSTFVLSDLEYLYKGGRCSGVARFGANVLGIKPSIAVTPEGSLEVSKKYRGKIDSVYRQYVTDRLLDLKRMDTGRIVLADSGGVAPDTLAFLRGVISGKTGCKELILADAGCTISSHCGPGTLAVFYLQK